jgi:2-methylene-furan-3-one reductase
VCSASRFTAFQGKLKLVVDSVYRFEDALGAYERIMTSRATGKVVVKVDGSL